MRPLRKLLVAAAATAFACALLAQGQDAPQSLGDVARQSRQQKLQKDAQGDKDTPGKDSPSKDAPTKDAATKDASTSKDAATTDTTVKDTTAKDAQPAKTPHVYTNDEIPEHVGSTVPAGRGYQNQYANYPQTYGNGTAQPGMAEQWKSQIQSMKSAIANMQAQINNVNESIHYAGGNCVSNCVQWNERQKQRQDQVEIMKQQLDQLQKRLEDMQEMARKQGFGSSVYDP